MVVIGKRSNIDPLENFYFEFGPMVGEFLWYPGVTNWSPNGSNGKFIGGGIHFFPVSKNGHALPNFVYVLVKPLPNYILSLSDVEQRDDKIAFTSGISKCPLMIADIEPPSSYVNAGFSFKTAFRNILVI